VRESRFKSVRRASRESCCIATAFTGTRRRWRSGVGATRGSARRAVRASDRRQRGCRRVDVEPERQHPRESNVRLSLHVPSIPGARQHHPKHGRIGCSLLGYRDVDRHAVKQQDTAVGRTVPGINLVERSPAQRPNGQVESERRARMQNQRDRPASRSANARASRGRAGRRQRVLSPAQRSHTPSDVTISSQAPELL
jgi:hypothetical protein